jgi:hypothetical protein
VDRAELGPHRARLKPKRSQSQHTVLVQRTCGTRRTKSAGVPETQSLGVDRSWLCQPVPLADHACGCWPANPKPLALIRGVRRGRGSRPLRSARSSAVPGALQLLSTLFAYPAPRVCLSVRRGALQGDHYLPGACPSGAERWGEFILCLTSVRQARSATGRSSAHQTAPSAFRRSALWPRAPASARRPRCDLGLRV